MFEKIKTYVGKRFISVYAPDGVRFEKEKFFDPFVNKVSIDNSSFYNQNHEIFKQLEDYTLHPLIILSFLLGLPNHPPVNKQPGILNLFYNFVGWQPIASYGRAVINITLSPFIIFINLIAMPFRAVLNIAKLFTEFLPQLILNALFRELQIMKQEQHAVTNISERRMWQLRILLPLGFVATVITAGFTILGYASTSPIDSIRSAFSIGSASEEGWHSSVIGATLATFSLLISISVYTLFFPLAAKLLTSSVLPYLANHLPASIVKVANWLSQTLTPTLTVIGNTITPFAINSISILSCGFLSTSLLGSMASLSGAAVSGLGALVALGIGTIGTMIGPLHRNLKSRWHTMGQLIFPGLVSNLDNTVDDEDNRQNRKDRTHQFLGTGNPSDPKAVASHLESAPMPGPGPVHLTFGTSTKTAIPAFSSLPNVEMTQSKPQRLRNSLEDNNPELAQLKEQVKNYDIGRRHST